MRSFAAICCLAALILIASPATARAYPPAVHPTGFLIRVPQDAPTIQIGINAASDGDTVLVAEGNYFENINFRGKSIVVTGLTIHDGDTSHISRTVIDGSTPAHPDSGSVVSFVSEEDSNAVLYGFTIRNGTGTRFGSMFPPFMTGARVGGGIFCYESGPTILRTVIQNNSVNGDTAVGAGLYALAYARKPHLRIDQCVLRNNTAQAAEQAWGGGASMHGVRGRITGSIIADNALASHGSALGGGLDIWRYRADTVTIGMAVEGNRITGNRVAGYDGAWGGGLINTEGSFRIVGNTIDSNIVSDTVGGAYGGGLHIEDGLLTGPVIVLSGNRIRWNTVESNGTGFGGGMVIQSEDMNMTGGDVRGNTLLAPDGYGAAVARILGTSATHIDSCFFFENTAPTGVCRGTIYVSQNAGMTISRSWIEGNTAAQGGGIHLRQTAFRIENSYLRSNAATDGGALFINGAPFIPGPGRTTAGDEVRTARFHGKGETAAVVPPVLSQEIVNCTMLNNGAARYGGALYATGGTPVMMNCLAWGDTAVLGGSEIHLATAGLQVRYSDVRLGWAGSGNIDAAPAIADEAGNLSASSPCIGAGIDTMLVVGEWYYAPLKDMDGGTRPNPWGTLPDIGAHESPLSLPGGVLRSYPVQRGWGLVSVPLTLADYHKTVVYPTAASEAWAYHGSYVVQPTLANGLAYWLKFDSAHAVPMTGLLRVLDTLQVDSGWNLIGGISTAVDTGGIVKIPAGLLRSAFFGYTPAGYSIVGAIEPMQGYWVRASVPGMLVLSASAPAGATGADDLAGLGSVKITDAGGTEQRLYFGPGVDPDRYLMPPPPPAGVMDVRFAGGSLVTAIDQEIRISGGIYPVRVTLEGNVPAALVTDGHVASGDVLTLSGPGSALALRVGEAVAHPVSFALDPGYPNPFNPATVIGYALPVKSLVTLTVYTVLGQEVSVLVSGIQSAGRAMATWNATGSPSGVYLVRMEALPVEPSSSGKFMQTQKVVLIK